VPARARPEIEFREQRTDFVQGPRRKNHLVPGLDPQLADSSADAARADDADLHRRGARRKHVEEGRRGCGLQESPAVEVHPEILRR
jgi:hypothetical protein